MLDKDKVKEYLEAVIVAVVIAFFIINFVAQAFYIPSGSMRPELQPGDRIFANKFIYRFREPRRQEVVVFKYPVEPELNFIKRIIGMPGDRVEIVDGQVYINDQILKEGYILEESYSDFSEVQIPEDNYFVLGDNRNNSEDSRYWGFVPRENIVGQGSFIFWPLTRIGLIN
ncbi:signal peptidase I [Natroniella sp. ANB-PHB2]|uniref:signal peptidase I n=1 Tax=Natroniella sp. ANB-PHB2 TaxID=3384444 RepID=UPI0038D3FB27